ncbi:single-stranded DNA-binding protein [Kytococcus sp. Marseille-QA3725]
MSETYLTVTGNVATQPILRIGRTGTPFLTFRLAQNINRLDRSTGVIDTVATNWMTVCAFRHHAVNLYRSLAKGQPVIVHGRLRIQDWTTDERSGTTVELEATSVGHDLSRGQSCFVKVASPPVPQADDAAEDRRRLRLTAVEATKSLPEASLPVFLAPQPVEGEEAVEDDVATAEESEAVAL